MGFCQTLAGTESTAGTGQHGRGFPRRTPRRMHGSVKALSLSGLSSGKRVTSPFTTTSAVSRPMWVSSEASSGICALLGPDGTGRRARLECGGRLSIVPPRLSRVQSGDDQGVLADFLPLLARQHGGDRSLFGGQVATISGAKLA